MNLKINEPIKGSLIKKWLPNSNVILYSELKKYKKLPKLPIVILYEIIPGLGHWVTVLRTPEGIEHFDSYGYKPDDELDDFIPEKIKKQTNQDYKYLLNLLNNTGEQINYNNYKLQGEPPIATCGRWSILRNLFSYLTTDKFNNMIQKTSKELNLTPDEIVSIAI